MNEPLEPTMIAPNPEPTLPPAPKKNNTVIIVVAVLVVLCCCCAVVGGLGYYLWTNGDALLNGTGAISNLL